MTVAVVGGTGLVGSYLVEALLADPYFDTVRMLIRRPVDITHPKLEKKLVDFNDTESIRLALEDVTIQFCAIGTTQKKVKGDKAAYRKVDYDIPVNTARLGKLGGCETYILVSAAGANVASRNFYLQLKGEVEEIIRASGVASVYIMRPSILLGDRKEFRLGEKIGKGVMKFFSFLLPSKYKAIHARTVARAMITASKSAAPGFHIWEYGEMVKG